MDNSQLQRLFEETKIDAIFSMSEQTRLWYAEVQTSAGYLLIEPNEATLIVDNRYLEYATKNAKRVKVKLLEKNVFQSLDKKFKTIGIEEEYLTIAEKKIILKNFPNAKLIPFNSQELRIIKSKKEIEFMKKAGSISMQALEKLKKDIKPGVTELSLAIKLETYQRELGASKGSFDSIVVSGSRGALPHGQPSNKKLQEGELLTIDFGALYKGYCSDITRTFQIGKVTNSKLLEIVKIVKKAQMLGIKAIKPNIETKEIDKICRDYIIKKGYGKYFIHSTGHGLGIDVHELPRLTNNLITNKKLKLGMVITIEPGIYIEGLCGVRFEDNILVTKKGYEILSKK